MKTTKNNLSIIIALLLLVTSPQVSYGQAKKSQGMAVKIGEKVPYFLFKTVLQYNKPTLSLSELKGKAIILDIWSTTCGPCIEALPKMAELQKKFGSQIMILPVCVNNELRTVHKFLKNRKGTKFEMKLPTVVLEPGEEKSFKAIFPFADIPHEIWIDKDGVLRATTDARFVTEEIIGKFLHGQTVDWQMQTYDPNFNERDALFSKEIDAKTRSFMYKSSISGFQEGIQSLPIFYKDSSSLRITLANRSILELIKTSLQGETTYQKENLYVHAGPFDADVHNKQLLVKTIKPDRFIRETLNDSDTTYARWFNRNAKCYELVLPSSSTWEEALNFMKQDLERFFRIEITVQQLPVKYLALIKSKNYSSAIESDKDQQWVFKQADDRSSLFFQNRPVELLRSFIEDRNIEGPMIKDETGIRGNINVSLALEKDKNFKEYNTTLNKLGFNLIEKTATMPVLVIADK